MFYFEKVNGKKVLKSTLLKEVNHFFTTREGFDFDVKTLRPEQTHSDNVEFVDERNFYPNTDGLILTKTNTSVCLKFADCTPIILYNPNINIGGVVHAGWRGTAQKIAVKGVNKINSVNNGKNDDIIAIIGPAIGLCCYEVSEEVKEKLLTTVNDTTELYNGRHVDLKSINARQLQEIGVKTIDICPYCTSCNNDLFYSYRKENGTTQRHFAFLELP